MGGAGGGPTGGAGAICAASRNQTGFRAYSAFGMSLTVELPRTAGPGSGLGGMWNVVVLNDSHNTFDHVAETLADHLPGISLADGYRIADRIHRTGCAIVWSGVHEDAERYWMGLDGAGLTMAPLEAA